MASTTNRHGVFGISIPSGTMRCIAWAAAFAALLLVMPGAAQAAIFDWTGANSGDVSLSANYNGTLPTDGSDDLEFYQVALTGTFAPTTNSNAALSVAGLIFGGTIDPGSTIGIGGSSTITLGSGGISDSALEPVTLSLPITLSNSQNWTNNSTKLLTVSSSNIDTGPGGTTLTINATTGSVLVSGLVSDSGGLTITGGGGQTVTLSNTSNNYSGVTTISSGGILSTGNLGTLGASSLVIDSGTLRYTGPALPSTSLGFTMTNNGATLDASGTGPINFSNVYGGLAFSGAGPRTLTLTGGNTGLNTLAASISDNGSGQPTTLTKTGAGTWFLSIANGNNSFTGPVNLNLGVLAFDGLAVLGNGTAINFNGGTLRWYGGATDDISVRTVSINGPSINGPGGATFDLQGGTVALAHPIGNGGSGSLTVLGGANGLLALNAAATYTGNTNINQGTLKIGVANALPTGGIVSLGAAATNGTLDLNGFNQTVAGLSSANAGTPASQIVGNSSTSTASTLTITGPGTSIFNGSLRDVLPAGGNKTLALAVSGGTLNLGGSSNYSGGVTVSGGLLNANSSSALGTTTAPLNVTGSGSLNLAAPVTLANVSLLGSGTVSTSGSGSLGIPSGGTLTTAAGTFNPSGAPFTLSGANIGASSPTGTMTLNGGTLAIQGGTNTNIALHWCNYAGNGDSSINATTNPTGDGVVNNTHWTNVGVNWFAGGATGLVDSKGNPTTAAVTCVGPNGGGTYWWVTGPAGGVDNLLEGPWGGDGGGGAEAVPAVITGIPFSQYEIIAYTNPPYAGAHDIWLDSKPGLTSSAANAPVAGSQYYYSQDSNAFVQITNQNATLAPAGNYVVWTGLTASSQTIWDGGIGGATNEGISGFEIVDTTPVVLSASGTTVALTAASTLKIENGNAPTFGDLTLNGTGASLAITSGTAIPVPSATFGNVTVGATTAVGPNGAVNGVAAVTLTGSSINVTNATDVLTLPATTNFNASPVTLNGNAGAAGKLVLGNAATFAASLTNPTLNVNAGTLQFTPAAGGSSTINGSLNVLSGAVLSPGAAALNVTAGGTVSLNAGSIYEWSYTSPSAYSSLNVTAGSFSLPATAPTLMLNFTTAPTPSVGSPLILATWPTGDGPALADQTTTWPVNSSLLPPLGTAASWTGPASGGLFATAGNWTSNSSYTAATVAYTATQLELTGLTLGSGGGSKLTSIGSTAALTIAPSSTSSNVTVTGPSSPMPISSLSIGGANAPATATLNLVSGGNLTLSNGLTINSNGALTTAGANLNASGATISSGGTFTVSGASTVTAATLNVLGGTTSFGGTSTAAVTNLSVTAGTASFLAGSNAGAITSATVSNTGQLSALGSGSIASLNVQGTGASGVTIGGTVAVTAATLSGGTTTFSTNQQSLTTVGVSGTAIVNFNGPTTNISDTTTGLNVIGGSVTFGTGAGSTAGTIALLNVSGGTVGIDGQTVTTANLSGGSTTVAGNVAGTSQFGSTALSLFGPANLTVNGGIVGGANGTVTFDSAYSGTATFKPAATIQTGTATQTAPTPPATTLLTVPVANIAIPTGMPGVVNLNNSTDLTSLTVGGGTVTRTGNVQEGTANLPAAAGATGATTVSGGSLIMIGNTDSANVSGGSYTLTGNVAGTASVTGGTFGATAGTIASLSLPTGSTGIATVGAGAAVTNASVAAGTATFNGPVTNTLSATGGTTNLNNTTPIPTLNAIGGAVNVGPGATAITATLTAGAVNATNPLSVTQQLNTPAGQFNWTPVVANTPFTLGGANVGNIANNTVASTMTLTGGTLSGVGGTGGTSLGVCWSSYIGAAPINNAPSGDGPAGYTINTWNNLAAGFDNSPPIGGLVTSTGATTTITAKLGTGNASTGAYGAYPQYSTDPLLIGVSGYGPLATQIANIPFGTYSIVLFTNNYPGGGDSAWVDSNPSNPNSADAHSGNTYYFTDPSQATQLTNAFTQSTNTTNTGVPAANYVVFTGLSGPTQTLWLANNVDNLLENNWSSQTGGFEIIDTTLPNMTLPQTNIAVTASSTLNLSGTPTLGDVSLKNGSTLTLAGATSMTLGNITLAAGTTLDAATNSIPVTAAGLADFNGSTAGETVKLGSTTLTVGSGNTPTTFSGLISGTGGSLVKVGSSSLTLAGTGTYTGGTSVEDGLLVIDSSEAILSGSTVATTPNGAIVLGDPSLPSDGTSLGGLVPGSGGGLAASPNVVPEPGTLALLAAACGFAMLWLRRKGRG